VARMPAAEVDVTTDLVRTLLQAQHPDLAGLPLTVLGYGWDNAMLRLGDELLVRLPRRAMAAELVAHEQDWLPSLAARLPAPVPAPVRAGLPGAGYPWRWSVLPWFEGTPLTSVAAGPRTATAGPLGTFLAALHVPAPDDVWSSPYRGVPLAARHDLVTQRVDRRGADADRLRGLWREAAADPLGSDPRLWLHGDVHPLNVLIRGGDLAAVIDWGDLTAGDPAGDLAIAWLGYDAAGASAFRAAYDDGVTHDLDLDRLWRRARGWAIHLSLTLLEFSDDHAELDAVGRHGIARLLEGDQITDEG
jgi:aminoglycoside phosphotransferase (APT) family kinase protein